MNISVVEKQKLLEVHELTGTRLINLKAHECRVSTLGTQERHPIQSAK